MTEIAILDKTLPGNVEVGIDDNYPAPQDPRSFNERLRRDFGELEGFTRYRVIWGQDSRVKIWQAGRYHLRYIYAIRREERMHGATILNTKLGKSKTLNFKQAENYIPKDGELILPKIEHYEKEIGDPFFWLEYYAPPHYFGTPDEWNLHRWFDPSGDGHKIDLTGAFPRNGRYEPLLRMSKLTDEGEDFLPINDNTYDWIRSMLQGDEKKLAQALQEQRTRFDREAEAVFNDPDIDKQADYAKKHSHSIITS